MLEEAKALIELGMPIIPVCPADHAHMSAKHIQRCRCPGKTPLIAGWTTHNKTTLTDLQNWQTQFHGSFNIGLPLGDASKYCGIDVDGDAGVQLLMQMSHGNLPNTWEFATAAGSRLLYRIPDGIKTKKFKQTGAGPHEECALLCTGQQTVMPPSKHHTGATYQWVDGHSPLDIPCAIAPKWLIERIQTDEPVSRANTIDLTTVANKPNFFSTPSTSTFDFNSEFEATTEDMDVWAESMDPADSMLFDVPTGAPPPKNKKSKAGHKVVVSEEMLSERIPEGQRDNTMTAIVGHYCANRDLRRLGKEMILNVCLQHNRQYCDPPLEDQAIIDKVNYFFEMESSKDAQYAAKGKSSRPPFEASVMAKNVIKHLANQGIILQYDQFTHMYYYTMDDEGPWRCTHNITLINRWIREVIISAHYGDPAWDKRSYIEETRAAIEEIFTSPFKNVSDFDLGAHADELSKYIICNDGMLDWKEKRIVNWTPEYHTTISFPVDYVPDADCPHFKQYLTEWLPDESVRMVIQEYLGYCLIPNTNFRKALFLYGKGRNGKSIFIEFLQDFFGDLSGTLSYDALFQRFGPANLKDKLVNVYDDTNVSFTKDTGIAKNLIAGGQISAEFKGKDHFTFTNVARIIFSAQETPRTADNSLAWYDRWIFVKFPNTFRASNAKKEEMIRNMHEEVSGIFNWMLDGLRRLMENDSFTPSKTLKEYTQEYRGTNDNVVQFINTYCKSAPINEIGSRISVTNMYRIYEMFVEKENLRCFSKKMFSARIEDSGYPIRLGKVGTSNARYFEGLALDMENEAVREYLVEIRVILTTNG